MPLPVGHTVVGYSFAAASGVRFRKHLWTDAREVIVRQLQLLSLTRTEEELLPVDVTVRTELVGLMARILVAVFQTEIRRTDERASIQSQDQAGTFGS